jgi:hypothetical protein
MRSANQINVLALSLAATVMFAGHADASNYGQLVTVEVLPRSYAAPIQSFSHQGQSYVAGVQNQEFRVRLRNTSGERVLAVLSVDGVNAVSGQTAGFDQPGYVLAPYQTLDVDGWRKSQTRTAAFYFTHIADSYAANTGRAENVGVIGAAVFREAYASYDYQAPQTSEPWGRSDDRYNRRDRDTYKSSPAPAASADAESAQGLGESKRYSGGAAARSGAPIGTGHGRSEYSATRRVQFERDASPYEVLNIRYDSLQNLVAMGVVPRYQPSYPGNPDAFPQGGGYVPDPPRYGFNGYRR